MAALDLLTSEDTLSGVAYGVGLLGLWVVAQAGLNGVHGARSPNGANAYYLVSLVPIFGLVCEGLLAAPLLWSMEDAEDRLFADLAPARRICRLQLGYQVFCIVAGLLCGPPLNKLEAYVHHLAAGVAAVLSFLPYAQYYCIYFGAIVEISNVPLTGMDVFKLNRHLIEEIPGFYATLRLVFAATFLFLRSLVWPVFAHQMVLDVLAMREKVHIAGQLITFTVLIALTALQAYWGYLVIRGLAATVQGHKKDVRALRMKKAP